MSENYIQEIIETRRAIHRRPELGWTEFETMWNVCNHLERWAFRTSPARRSLILTS